MKLDKEDQIKIENHIRNSLGEIISESSIKTIFNNGIVSKEELKLNNKYSEIKLFEFLNKFENLILENIVLKNQEFSFEEIVEAFSKESNSIFESLSNILEWSKSFISKFENYSEEDFKNDLSEKINLIDSKEYKKFFTSKLIQSEDKIHLLESFKKDSKNQDLIFKDKISNYISSKINIEELKLKDLIFLKDNNIQTINQLNNFMNYVIINEN